MHLYAAGGHAFNIGEDTPLTSLQHWPQRVLDWLSDRGLLGRRAPVFVPKQRVYRPRRLTAPRASLGRPTLYIRASSSLVRQF